mgnify:CR=1 FL=1
MNRSLSTRLSLMMFLEFFIWGSWYVTIGNYMAAVGMTDAIAWAYTVHPIGAIVSPFFLGMVADRFFATEKVLGVLHLLGGAALLAVSWWLPDTAQALVAYLVTWFLLLAAPLVAAWRSPRDSQRLVRLYGGAVLVAGYAGAGLTDLMFGFEFHTALYVVLAAVLIGYCRDRAGAGD